MLMILWVGRPIHQTSLGHLAREAQGKALKNTCDPNLLGGKCRKSSTEKVEVFINQLDLGLLSRDPALLKEAMICSFLTEGQAELSRVAFVCVAVTAFAHFSRVPHSPSQS